MRGPLDPAADGRRPFLPSRDDPVVRVASGAIGGPWGRHGALGLRQFWTPLRVLLALTLLTLAFAWAEKSPCQDGAWTEGKQYTHFCYSDVIPLYFTEHLDQGAVPYADQAVEYPVLTGAFMGVAAGIADKVPLGMPDVQAYFTVTALLLSLSMLVVTWSTYRLAGRRRWDAAMVALSPLVIVHAFTNWDLFAVAIAGAGHGGLAVPPARAGRSLLGLGTAAKLYPALFFIPLLALCWRSRQLPAFGRAVPGAVAAGPGQRAGARALAGVLDAFLKLNRQRPADFDSLWYGFAQIIGRQDPAPKVNAVAAGRPSCSRWPPCSCSG